jgi:hypothetical protein
MFLFKGYWLSTKYIADLGPSIGILKRCFPGFGNTIIKEEIDWVNDHILPVKVL